ncbi:MAG TPA: glycosyltransferase family 2 protein [Patescibacteria group bacterium]|nr:glycosyltransferase family 2 protein [Patescibacteria group bacterium]
MKEYTVSIVIPARNEAGTISKMLPLIPKFGLWQEINFVEGGSTDNTWPQIQKVVSDFPKHFKNVAALKQTGVGKANALRDGIKKAQGDIIIILDADLSVSPKALKGFYEVLRSNPHALVIGNRFTLPMQKNAMPIINKLGNICSASIFSFLLGIKLNDLACGMKGLFKSDYLEICDNNPLLSSADLYGDFLLIIGAAKRKMKIIEIPVHYKSRIYGSSNFSKLQLTYHMTIITLATLITIGRDKLMRR